MSLSGLLVNPLGLAPHFCLTCVRGLLWLYAGADALILVSYLSIPISLVWLLRRRHERAYRWIGYLMVSFILAGAATHGLSILTLWVPVYGIEGLAKALTAVGSLTVASVLWIMAPRLAAIKSTAQLTAANEELSRVIIEREAKVRDLQDAEQRLRISNAALESVVSEYAEELRSAGAQLHKIFEERLAMQNLLARREEEEQASFDTATVGKVQIEPPSGRLLRVNDAFAGMLGYRAKDLIGRDIWDLTYPDDRAAARAMFDRLLAREVDHWIMEKRFVRRDGAALWGRISATVVIDPAIGLPRLVLAEIEDLDLRHDLHSVVRAADARLRLALESLQVGVIEVDIPNRLFWASARLSAMTGGEIPAETWLVMNSPIHAAWVRRIHPDDRTRREMQLRCLFAGKTAQAQIELRIRRDDGGWSHLLQRYAVVERDPASGSPSRAVGIVSDVTAQVCQLIEAETERANLAGDLARRKAALAQRHLLLREVYHRMNEALNFIDRCLVTAGQAVSGAGSLQTLSVQRNRIAVLGSVHAELLARLDVDTFDVASFLRDLCDCFLSTAGYSATRLHLEAEQLEMSLDHVIPLGLLVAELLVQCCQYGSADDRQIAVGLRRSAEAAMILSVSVQASTGAAAADQARFTAGLQTRRVRDLVSQLDAQLKVSEGNGMQAEVTVSCRAV